jgi:hypothetical protein
MGSCFPADPALLHTSSSSRHDERAEASVAFGPLSASPCFSPQHVICARTKGYTRHGPWRITPPQPRGLADLYNNPEKGGCRLSCFTNETTTTAITVTTKPLLSSIAIGPHPSIKDRALLIYLTSSRSCASFLNMATGKPIKH